MIKVCKTSDVLLGKAKNYTVQNIELSIIHTKDGYFARSGVCKHNGFKLELCTIKGCTITCPLHGWVYNINSGKGIKPIHTNLDQYGLELRGEEIWVDVSEKAKKDFDIDTSNYQW